MPMCGSRIEFQGAIEALFSLIPHAHPPEKPRRIPRMGCALGEIHVKSQRRLNKTFCLVAKNSGPNIPLEPAAV